MLTHIGLEPNNTMKFRENDYTAEKVSFEQKHTVSNFRTVHLNE